MMPTYGPAMSAKSRSATTGGSAAEWCVVSDVRVAQIARGVGDARPAARRTEEVDGEQHVERRQPSGRHLKRSFSPTEDRGISPTRCCSDRRCGGAQRRPGDPATLAATAPPPMGWWWRSDAALEVGPTLPARRCADAADGEGAAAAANRRELASYWPRRRTGRRAPRHHAGQSSPRRTASTVCPVRRPTRSRPAPALGRALSATLGMTTSSMPATTCTHGDAAEANLTVPSPRPPPRHRRPNAGEEGRRCETRRRPCRRGGASPLAHPRLGATAHRSAATAAAR